MLWSSSRQQKIEGKKAQDLLSKGVENMTDTVIVQRCWSLVSVDSIVGIIDGVLARKLRDALFQSGLRRPSNLRS